MKKIALALILVIISLLLAACGQKISHEGTLAMNDGSGIVSSINERG